MERREFLRCAAGAVFVSRGGLVVNTKNKQTKASKPKPKLERRNERPTMNYARLGRTNLMVSQITCGGLHINRQRIPLLARLYDGGVNLFDTAHIYGGGRSEQAIGDFFSKKDRRKKIFLSTKLDLRSELKRGEGIYKKAMSLTETSLRRLKTDHVDIVFLHGCTTLIDYVNNEEWLRAAADLKKQGKARFIGISEHQKPAEVLKLAAENGQYDVCMAAFSLVKAKWGVLGRADIKSMGPPIKAAQKAGMGLIAIKTALRAEQIVAGIPGSQLKAKQHSPHQLCYRYVLGISGVTTVTCGMTNMKHVQENLAVPNIKLAFGDVQKLLRTASASRVCGFCGTCMDVCPNAVAVQDILRFHAYHNYGYRSVARSAYASLQAQQQFPSCQSCGACEAACPAHVPIRRNLSEAHRALV